MNSLLCRYLFDDLLKKSVLFDANIFMVGITERLSNKNCSFENIKKLFIIPILESFSDILIHEEVYKELDAEAKLVIEEYVGKNVKIVKEEGLYGKDPRYTRLFNSISGHDLVGYTRGSSKDRGEVYSLAYAAYHNVNYFCSREIMVDLVANDLPELKKVGIITFDIILAVSYYYYLDDSTIRKGLKSAYKKYCADVIKRHKLPDTLVKYMEVIVSKQSRMDKKNKTKEKEA